MKSCAVSGVLTEEFSVNPPASIKAICGRAVQTLRGGAEQVFRRFRASNRAPFPNLNQLSLHELIWWVETCEQDPNGSAEALFIDKADLPKTAHYAQCRVNYMRAHIERDEEWRRIWDHEMKMAFNRLPPSIQW